MKILIYTLRLIMPEFAAYRLNPDKYVLLRNSVFNKRKLLAVLKIEGVVKLFGIVYVWINALFKIN